MEEKPTAEPSEISSTPLAVEAGAEANSTVVSPADMDKLVADPAGASTLPPKPKYEENQLLGTHVTIDGLLEIRWRTNRQVTVIPPIPEHPVHPKKFKPEHARAFRSIMALIDQIKKTKDRILPLMQSEAWNLMEKQTFKELERMDFIKTKLVQLNSAKEKLGGRMVCWITPNGKAFERDIRQAEMERLQRLIDMEKSAQASKEVAKSEFEPSLVATPEPMAEASP
jgi:hypothetical protein